MYVWFDALTSYISTLGWPVEDAGFSYWKEGGPVQYCGKDNLRQQSAIWQAMLLAADLPTTKHIIIDGFIISGGQKMSKSIGNVINPFDILDMFKGVTDYPEDVLRFILLHEVPSFEDGDITVESIQTAYTAYLANGIGNLTSRVMKMAVTNDVTVEAIDMDMSNADLDIFDTNNAIKKLMQNMRDLDERIATNEPFKLVKTDVEAGKTEIKMCLQALLQFAQKLAVFLPQTSAQILACIKENKLPEKSLFARLVLEVRASDHVL